MEKVVLRVITNKSEVNKDVTSIDLKLKYHKTLKTILTK